MAFKHAQVWIVFNVLAANSTTASALTINSITLNDVSCQGTFTVTHANWDQTKEARDAADPAGSKDGSVSGVWSAYSTYKANVPAVVGSYSDLSTSSQEYGSLMVVPAQGITSFTINYTVDSKSYDFVYELGAPMALSQASKYVYNITFTLHEIEIAASVVDWTDETPVAVPVGN